jgi:5-methylcytosine-specific restriction endonuclease McrA
MTPRRSLRNQILRQISTLRIPCVTSSSRSVWRSGPARKRNPRSIRTRHLRRDEYVRNARGKKGRRGKCYKEGRTPCAAWRSCSNPWEFQETMGKRCHREGAEAEVLHHLGETDTGQDGVGPLDHIPPVLVGEVQADPGPHGGENSQDSCEVISADVLNSIVPRILTGL